MVIFYFYLCRFDILSEVFLGNKKKIVCIGLDGNELKLKKYEKEENEVKTNFKSEKYIVAVEKYYSKQYLV